jgi:membrane protease YdiL (CAAX protease family)
MTGPAWEPFAAFLGFVTLVLVGLARLSASMLSGPAAVDDAEAGTAADTGTGDDPRTGDVNAAESGANPAVLGPTSPGALLANVALSQGLLGVLLVFVAWFYRVPASTFGLGGAVPTVEAVALGVGLGLALSVVNELLARVAERAGVGYSETARELLAPDGTLGWVVLLGVALPVVAGFEELLFRGALVGALSVGFGVSPWLLAILSSAVFGFAHGVQGPVGMLVTGLLGVALAAAFVLTGSLVVVVVAHYLVNALEFVVHEGGGVEWPSQ